MRIHTLIILLILSVFMGGAALAKPVSYEHYSRLPAVYDAAISPDGKFMAAIIDNEGEYILRVFNLEDPADKKVRAMAFGEGVGVKWVKWANNGQVLVSVNEIIDNRGGIYYTGYLYVMDRDVTSSEMLVKPEVKGLSGNPIQGVRGYRQFNNVVIDFLEDDPEHILMSFGEIYQTIPEVHKVNINTKFTKMVEKGDARVQDWTTDLRSEVRVGEGRENLSGVYRMKIRDADSKKWRKVKEYPGITENTGVYGFMENPNEMIVGSRQGKDTVGLYIYDLGKKQITRKLYHHDVYDMNGIVKSADGKKIVGVTYFADTVQTIYFDDAYKAQMAKIQDKLKGFQVRVIDQTPDGNTVIFKVYSASVPPFLYIYTAHNDSLEQLVPDFPEIKHTVQGDVTSVKYKARDGYKIPSYVTLPPKIADGMPLKNLPFIIMPHGGPYARDAQAFDPLAQFMTSRGYGVLQMNFRGSAGLGQAHKEAGRGNWEVMQEDVEDGVRWLLEKGYADPKRICIVGWSYGGYAALMGAIKNSDLYACSVSIAGVTDLNDMVKDMAKYRFGNHVAKSSILSGFDGRRDIKENSPVKRASEFKVPLLLAHGTKDVTVHYDQFTRMKRALKKSKTKVTYLTLEDGDHSLTSFEDRRDLYKALDKFLSDNLGESAAAP